MANDYTIKEKEVYDSYLEHEAYHQSYHKDCSTCYKENRLIRAHHKVNEATHADLLERYPGLNNSYGSNYPLNFRPE